MSAPQASDPTHDSKPEKPRKRRRKKLISWILVAAHILGVASSFDALMSTRTSQGAIAWILSLNMAPLVAVPSYWVFGRNKFQGYVTIREEIEKGFDARAVEIRAELSQYVVKDFAQNRLAQAAESGAMVPFFNSNRVELLVDGEATFESIFEGIECAEDYVLVQFYIIHDDDLGKRLKEALIAKAREGVQVRLLYDEIGSGKIDNYMNELRAAGVQATAFHSTRGGGNRFQLNFRNHRKVVVVDGEAGWIGGHNVGDEYLGKDPDFPNWRDTHMKITGPSTLQLQLAFTEDWRWATDQPLGLPFRTSRDAWNEPGETAEVLIVPTGPADRLETCSLMYQQAIHSAKDRIWIASPYFVPDHGVMSALHLATLRGVDVRILIPEMPDSKLVYYSAYAFIGELIESGVSIYRYQPGFMHQKVFLVDSHLSGVGTANFDNRSFRLNFEITALVSNETFASEVESMLLTDFGNSRLMTLSDVEDRSKWSKLLSRASYLTAPIQ